MRIIDHETDRAELEALCDKLAAILTDYETNKATGSDLYRFLCELQNDIAAWEYH